MSKVKLSGKYTELDLEDRLNWLKMYNEVLNTTQSLADGGNFDDKPDVASTIMRDYIEKSGELIKEILRMIFGDEYYKRYLKGEQVDE